MQEIKIIRPDDFHVHLRQDRDMAVTVRETAKVFGRALVMPNTKPPILKWKDVCDYREKIEEIAWERLDIGHFTPKMTIQLTDATTAQDIRECRDGATCFAGKLYPAGVTTNSHNGVTDIKKLYPVFAQMEESDMTLCLHGETPGVHCMDRELDFLKSFIGIVETFPKLRIVLEHLSTAAAVRSVEDFPDNVAATITAHHLLLTLDDVVGDLLHPHHFCKPIPKRPEDRAALIKAATGGNPKFFFGSDSAPHAKGAKECADGCAGVFSAPVAMAVLASVFEKRGLLDRLEGFTSRHGAAFYGLPLNEDTITLRKEAWTVPEKMGNYVPFLAGQPLDWKIVG